MTPRQQFNLAFVNLLQAMFADGQIPLVDFVKRSNEEQTRLFNAGLSKCDGVKNKSKHQTGMAVDIYLTDQEGRLKDWTMDGLAVKYHTLWESLGGKPILSWDQGHFEF
jgi:hypothetical protein